MRGAFELGMADAERLAAATIPVERIRGAVLLISAGDDRSWPCDTLSDIAARRLAEHHHPYEYRHICYSLAGHQVCVPPHGPTTDTVVPGPGVLLDLGGAPADTTAARRAAWGETLAFLGAHL
jgi:dienelactone hydrolase